MKKILFLSLILALQFALPGIVKSKHRMTATAGATVFMAGAVASIRDLEREAHDELSNYDGDFDEDDYDSYSGYDGSEDDFLDFGGQPGNLLNAVEGHNYTVVLTNAKNAARTIYFMPSAKNKTAAGALTTGTMTDGVFAAIDDTGVETNITAVSDNFGSVDFLRRFIENNPTYVRAFQIQSSTAAGIQQCKIEITQVSPFRQLDARILKPTMYQDQTMMQDKVINIPAGFDMNDQCQVKMTIAASTTLTVTIVCGAVLNGAAAMQNKRAKALRNKRRR